MTLSKRQAYLGGSASMGGVQAGAGKSLLGHLSRWARNAAVSRPFFDPLLVFFVGLFCVPWSRRRRARKRPKNGE